MAADIDDILTMLVPAAAALMPAGVPAVMALAGATTEAAATIAEAAVSMTSSLRMQYLLGCFKRSTLSLKAS